MSFPPRSDQKPGRLSAGVPGSRSGSSGLSVSLDTSGLALDTTVQEVNTTLGDPQQNATGEALTDQITNFGAQPFVPGLVSASTILAAPSASPATFHTFAADSRIWAATVRFDGSLKKPEIGSGSNGPPPLRLMI